MSLPVSLIRIPPIVGAFNYFGTLKIAILRFPKLNV